MIAIKPCSGDICHRYLVLCLLVFCFFTQFIEHARCAEASDREYLYFREVSIAPYQNMREFFELPERKGRYEIHVVSEAVAPLTVKLIRLQGENEKVFEKKRSFHLGDHQFQFDFANPTGKDDLAIEVANSNPTMKVKVSMVIIELAEGE